MKQNEDREEIYKKFKRDMEITVIKINNMTMIWQRENYFRKKKRGDYSLMVDEWDLFEEERDLKKRENEMEDLANMSERRVLVRLSKHFNNVEVEVNGIESINDFVIERDWAIKEAINLVRELPNEAINKDTFKTVTKQEYIKAQPIPEKNRTAPYTGKGVNDNTNFVKGKQVGLLVKGLNAGLFTINEVRSLQDWPDTQVLIKKVFSNTKK